MIDVGAYTGSASPYGTFDQGGNVFEWNEQNLGDLVRGVRGGGWIAGANVLAASVPSGAVADNEFEFIGFRVAMVPEPGTGLLVMTGLLGLAARRRQRVADLRTWGGRRGGRRP